MKYLHTMVRVTNLEASLHFYQLLGLEVVKQREYPSGRFTLIYLSAPNDESAQLELTYNWDSENYDGGRNFGHLAYEVDDIYALCQKLADNNIVINRPPRDGHMAFIKSPDNISIELLQKGESLAPAEPWASMQNSGNW